MNGAILFIAAFLLPKTVVSAVMSKDDRGRTGPSSRRKFLLTGGTVVIAGLVGCSGGSDGGDEAGAGLSSDGDDSDGGSGGGDGDSMLSDSFDPESPDWANNNYLAAPLIDATYQRGTQTDLERMNDREVDEMPHGSPVQERSDDESEWLDPDTLVFTESPAEDRQQSYVEKLDPLIERLEETTGKDVEFTQVQSYAASVEAMRSERVHIANFATGATPFAVNLAGAVPFAVGFQSDGAFSFVRGRDLGPEEFRRRKPDPHYLNEVLDALGAASGCRSGSPTGPTLTPSRRSRSRSRAVNGRGQAPPSGSGSPSAGPSSGARRQLRQRVSPAMRRVPQLGQRRPSSPAVADARTSAGAGRGASTAPRAASRSINASSRSHARSRQSPR